uniref:Holocarboxylase synthetase (biotin-(proprionyl-CoA-carboxylase (ATP-hydrolysing)) ligase) n=1 Tax=Neogobius melanostomus TaxID=47308 RepID=A0A8C6UFE5_9GOBI
MLITLSYLYLWVRFQRGYAALLRDTLARLQRSPGRLSFSFSRCSSSPLPPQFQPRKTQSGHRHLLREEPAEEPAQEGVFLQLGDKAVYVTEPQACGDLSLWTVLPSSRPAPHRDISFIIEASGPRGSCRSPLKTHSKVLRWGELCVPLAHRSPLVPGQPYRALAQASVDDFSRLGVAFIEDRLRLEDDLRPSRIIPVVLEESAITALLQKRLQKSPSRSPCRPSSLCHLSVDEPPLVCRKGSLFLLPEQPRLEERRGSEPVPNSSSAAVSDPASLALLCDPGSQQHMEEHGHHLHLSSCHECLELENSTILSVKYASVENIPDLPDDGSAHVAAESPGDDVSDDDFATPSCDVHSKPPNVLVYTGDSEARFQTVRDALSKCVDTDSYMIYRLSAQQAEAEPWLDNCRLLVVAEEEDTLSAHLQTRFLTYLGAGGRVLGLASQLCPAGVSLRAQAERAGTMSFTREDSSSLELPVRTSGRVYVRDVLGGGEVELWGEMTGAAPGGMVIIRVTHGEDGGEAVLCQVHLEQPAEKLPSEAPDRPGVGDDLRHEVLTEILSSLGLSCEQSVAPPPSAVHLLSTSPEAKGRFVKWLRSQADARGLLRLPKAALRLVSCSEAESDPEEGAVALLWDGSDDPSPERFSLKTYSSHLRTERLGRTVLYGDVVTSTMDLLDGLTIRAPADVGLVAVAARQRHGKGRSRNGWLSPLGCAMFTVGLQVELSSRLGQRIPFLQHLMALAAVEAVRTLPGYQDIDLRVKWPNDIYSGSGLKLGGVLVTSTVLGSTFHLLIGCGFNVSNSAPTVCINDLIQRHNQERGTELPPLSCDLLIARSLNLLEKFISDFQSEGPDAVLPTYYSRWIHSGTRVRLWSEEGPEADVVGLDQNGFLQVHCPQSGLLSVEPDGNSFDMLKNLLVMKQH